MSSNEKTVMFALPNVVTGQLACVAGTAAGRSWELSAGTFVIGRLDENDLALPQEPGVSKIHAKIIGQADRYLITDCESRNGTLLNGQLIQRADLYDGDEIRICGCTLRFTQKGGAKRPRPQEAPPVAPVAAVANDFGPPTAQLPAPSFAPPNAMAPSLPPQALPPPSGGGRVLAGRYAGGLLTSLLLGGAASAALVVNSPEPAPPTPPTPTTAVATTPTPMPPQPPTAAVPPPPTQEMATADAGVAATTPPPPPPPKAAPPPPTPTKAAPPTPTPEPEVADPEPDDAPSGSGTATTKKKRRAPRAESSSTAAATSSAPTEAAPSADNGGGTLYGAVVDGGKSETLKTRTGGRVKSVEVKDGDVVTKGQTLVTFESGADPAEIATLQDRIASLENAEDDEARRELKAAKQKLAALDGGNKAQPVVAGLDGKLSGFNVSVGSILKAGDVVGKVADGDVPSRVRITVPKGTKVAKGQTVQLVLRSGGTSDGTVVAISGKSVIVDTGAEAGDAVEAVRF